MSQGNAKYIGREDGAHLSSKTPPGTFYTDDRIFQRELEEFYGTSWLNVGRESQVSQPGDFFTREIGGQSVLVVRGYGGTPHAFYSHRRHRCTRLLTSYEWAHHRQHVQP